MVFVPLHLPGQLLSRIEGGSESREWNPVFAFADYHFRTRLTEMLGRQARMPQPFGPIALAIGVALTPGRHPNLIEDARVLDLSIPRQQ